MSKSKSITLTQFTHFWLQESVENVDEEEETEAKVLNEVTVC